MTATVSISSARTAYRGFDCPFWLLPAYGALAFRLGLVHRKIRISRNDHCHLRDFGYLSDRCRAEPQATLGLGVFRYLVEHRAWCRNGGSVGTEPNACPTPLRRRTCALHHCRCTCIPFTRSIAFALYTTCGLGSRST